MGSLLVALLLLGGLRLPCKPHNGVLAGGACLVLAWRCFNISLKFSARRNVVVFVVAGQHLLSLVRPRVEEVWFKSITEYIQGFICRLLPGGLQKDNLSCSLHV